MTAQEILKAARELLSDEAKWHKGHWSSRPEEYFGGQVDCHWSDNLACSWCVLGAIRLNGDATSNSGITETNKAVKALDAVIGNSSAPRDIWSAEERVTRWNDGESTTFEMLQDTLGKAIELAGRD